MFPKNTFKHFTKPSHRSNPESEFSDHIYFYIQSHRHIHKTLVNGFHSWFYSFIYRFFFLLVCCCRVLRLYFSFIIFIIISKLLTRKERYITEEFLTLVECRVRVSRYSENMIYFTRFKDFCVEHKSILNTRFTVC